MGIFAFSREPKHTAKHSAASHKVVIREGSFQETPALVLSVLL